MDLFVCGVFCMRVYFKTIYKIINITACFSNQSKGFRVLFVCVSDHNDITIFENLTAIF